MGVDVQKSEFSEQDFTEFRRKLRKETSILINWLENVESHKGDDTVLGLELETWIVDKDAMPSPSNEKVLEHIDHPLLVPELSKFNLEINAPPAGLTGNCFSHIQDELQTLWKKFQDRVNELGERLVMIGTLPTLRDEMLTLEYMSDRDRYRSMNRRVLELRGKKPIELKISGHEQLESIHNDIMLEAAATSFQVHLQTPHDKVEKAMNASIASSFAIIAASANSPYLFGKDLWDETRITIFEQAVELLGFYNAHGAYQNRVTFGGDYIRKNLSEMFLENLSSYDILIPQCFEKDLNWLSHLRLHNGNIWRWNRPIVGLDQNLQPRLRIEQRVLPSGPTTVDMVANMAFYVGLTHELTEVANLDELLPFDKAKDNFYAACKDGLNAKVHWEGKDAVGLQELILNKLLPIAEKGLERLAIDKTDTDFYLRDIIKNRVTSGQNGAAWQRSWVAMHGRDFQGLTEAYFHLQEKGIPVHSWRV